MTKVTIKLLEERVKTLTELRAFDEKIIEKLKQDLALAKAEVDVLKADKQWLKGMHSSMLQATCEMFKNR